MIGKSKRLMTYREKPSWTENGFKHHNRRSSPLSTRVECPAGLVGKCGKLTVTGAGYRIYIPYLATSASLCDEIGWYRESNSLRPFIRGETLFLERLRRSLAAVHAQCKQEVCYDHRTKQGVPEARSMN